jgi:hypothetical protein
MAGAHNADGTPVQSNEPTLRDKFAMAALPALSDIPAKNLREVADFAYQLADAMMARRRT